MNPEIEIRIVVAIAAVLVLSSLLLCLSVYRRAAQREARLGFAWLIGANVAFLMGTLGVMGHPVLPLWASASLAISGAFLGLLFGYFAVSLGLGAAVGFRWYGAFAVAVIIGQTGLAFAPDALDWLLVTSSIINGTFSLHVMWRIAPHARRHGPEITALAILPFAAMGAAYLFRLPLLAFGASAVTMTVATLVIIFLLAFSALQWAFALIAFRAAQLNERLEKERQRAEEANRLKSRFLANMSHELRTPLNGVLGMAQALQDLVRGPEQHRMVETISSSGEALMSILDDILDLSKIESGKMVLEEAPFRPADVVTRIARLHAPQAESKGLRFNLHCDASLDGLFLGDEHRLTQVLHNLTGNAVKFTESGQIDLRADYASGRLQINVTDTGIGMSEDQLANAFEEFVQADVSITRRFGGTGLGMPIVKHLVSMMVGGIKIDSRPGQGTQVRLDLPLRPAPIPQPEHKPSETLPIPDLSGMHILVAEDNLTNQKVVTALLRDTRVSLTVTNDGREALVAALETEFDLFLFDISMPEMDGPTALGQIRSAYGASGRKMPPAVALTANVMPEQIRSYAQAGFAASLPKPIRKSALLDCITNLTGTGAVAAAGPSDDRLSPQP
jgi:signal transduction histidine kinase/CheY-like chemotaxis protein